MPTVHSDWFNRTSRFCMRWNEVVSIFRSHPTLLLESSVMLRLLYSRPLVLNTVIRKTRQLTSKAVPVIITHIPLLLSLGSVSYRSVQRDFDDDHARLELATPHSELFEGRLVSLKPANLQSTPSARSSFISTAIHPSTGQGSSPFSQEPGQCPKGTCSTVHRTRSTHAQQIQEGEERTEE